MSHGWRDSRREPYRVGPSFWVRNGTLTVGDKTLAVLPLGAWVHVEVTAAVGTDVTGTWRLVLSRPGQPPETFDRLANGNPDFGALTWLGFSSSATAKTAFYLDNLEIRPE